MSSFNDGHATAELELSVGYPGYFYVPGDGDYICAVEPRLGLPIRLFGDCNPDVEWADGFNRGVLEWAEARGLPWNSRLSSLSILANLETYFANAAQQVVALAPGDRPIQFEPLGVSLGIENSSGWGNVSLTSEALFHDPGIVKSAMRHGRRGSPQRRKTPTVG
jgi:hypothetical protein